MIKKDESSCGIFESFCGTMVSCFFWYKSYLELQKVFSKASQVYREMLITVIRKGTFRVGATSDATQRYSGATSDW